MNNLLMLAAFTSALTCLTHVIVGGKFIARPLLASQGLNKIAKFTAYYCWHMVTITIAAMTIAFFITATNPDQTLLAIFATAGSFLFIIWNLSMIFLFKLRLLHFPQWILFLPGFAFGLGGLLS